METRDKITEFVNAKGPVLPSQISKLIGTDMIMASAYLAELTASKKLKISTIKVGGSPLYYLSGQESMLEKFTSNMNDKEKKAFDLLNQNKVLRDSEQEPVIRVALREIKDFAHPLNVNYNNNREIFWKWHLTNNEDAEKLIKFKLQISEKPAEDKIEELQKIETPAQPAQKQPKEKPKEAKKYKAVEKEDAFHEDIMKFFEKNKISVISAEILKKNSEMEFIIDIPSVVGNLQYYCRAKNKKRISDSDLSNAYVKGQLKRLPVLVLSPGDLSSKAQDMIGKELNNLTFKKI